VDVLCLLLSLIGGIKDINNVFVIASTNRLNKMDEAFCRRLQVKFFVGRLAPQQRLDILLKIEKESLKRGKHTLHYFILLNNIYYFFSPEFTCILVKFQYLLV
jgi:SpoVK/Ycf46/Vps4 family AAA+-type ATPase